LPVPPVAGQSGWRYDRFGRAVGGPGWVDTGRTPDWAGDRHRWLWEHARELRSTNLGTLEEFLRGLPFSRFEAPPSEPRRPASPPSKALPPRKDEPPAGKAGNGRTLVARTPEDLFRLLVQLSSRGEFDALRASRLVHAERTNESLRDWIGASLLEVSADLDGRIPVGPTTTQAWMATRSANGVGSSSMVSLVAGSWRLGSPGMFQDVGTQGR
jgi:hypothetical protein